MCLDTDLFGEVIILKSDVMLWLSEVAGLDQTTPDRRKEQYYKNYDLANIIRNAKLNGHFYDVKKQHDEAINNHQLQPAWLYPAQYTNSPPPVVEKCPLHFHVCSNDRCEVFIKRQAREKSHASYIKRKQSRALRPVK